jgi:hypothetical protein
MATIRVESYGNEDVHRFPSKIIPDRPADAEVNPDAPKQIDIPEPVPAPRGDPPSTTVFE